MTDALRKDLPSGVLLKAVPVGLDGWGMGRGCHGGMTSIDALPSWVRSSNAIEHLIPLPR